jgi:hypothetical protein
MALLVDDPTRVHHVIYRHSYEHERSIKDIQEYLVREQVPILSHNVFDNAKDRPNQDT